LERDASFEINRSFQADTSLWIASESESGKCEALTTVQSVIAGQCFIIVMCVTLYLHLQTTLREAIKKKIRSNLGHCPNREGGWLRIKLKFQSVYEIFGKIPIMFKTF
jgi:hypothetical protein